MCVGGFLGYINHILPPLLFDQLMYELPQQDYKQLEVKESFLEVYLPQDA